MWIAKIRLIDKKCIWATRCKKFNVYNYQYPLGSYSVKAGLALMMHHILDGEEKNIRNYIKDVKRDKRVKKLESKKNSLISLAVEQRTKKELEAFASLYNPKLIYTRPGINSPDGSETWEIGSFDRQDLIKVFNFAKREYSGKLLFLKQVKVPKIFMPEIMPELTEKQYNAFKRASEEGYYEFPRQTNLHKLARIAKISRPTYEEHLRKAEIKLLGFMKKLALK